MKAILLSYFFALSFLPSSFHDVTMAMFRITADDSTISIAISLDIEDFCNSVNTNRSDININSIQEYLDTHMEVSFNSKHVKIKVTDVQLKNDHIQIDGRFGKFIKDISLLNIQNSCLIDIEGHSNIFFIDLNNTSKDYRMSKDRTEIELRY